MKLHKRIHYLIRKQAGQKTNERSIIKIGLVTFAILQYRNENSKVMHHNHLNGEYLDTICNACNLKLHQGKS